ncbi:hypothetical protein V6N13_142393 [Hibiscus sabdariffa]
MATPKLDWRKLFIGGEEQALDFFPPQRKDSTIIVQPPSEVVDDEIDDWKNSLVGQFIGDAPNFVSIQRIIDQLWVKRSKVKQDRGTFKTSCLSFGSGSQI